MITVKTLRFKILPLFICSLWASKLHAQNDDFADAIDISHLEIPTSYYHFTSPETAELDEPAHAGQNAEHSNWLRWTPPQSGVYSIRDWNAPDDTRIAIYTGNILSTLTLVAEGLSPVYFTAQSNVAYSIALDHAGPEIVNLRSYNEGGADLAVNADVIPSSLPARVYGNNVFATRSPDDDDLGSFETSRTVWWSWTADTTGTVRFDFRDSSFYPAAIFYEVESDGSRTQLHNASGDSTLEATQGTEYLICVAEAAGWGFGAIEFYMHWIPSSVPPNDDIENARQLPSDKIVCDGEWIYHATAQPGLPNEDEGSFVWEPEEKSLWWKWTCPASSDYRVTAQGSTNATLPPLLVYSGTLGNLTLEAGNAGNEGATLSATSGTEYWIQIVQGRYSTRARCELNIHPFAGETPYFDELSRRYFRLLGAERHPSADPDGDGFANLVEAAFDGNLEIPDYNNPSLPHLVFHAGEWKLEWTQVSLFLDGGDLPLTIHTETSLNLASDWITSSPTGGSLKRLTLPSIEGRGFGRVGVEDPNMQTP